MLAFFKSYCYPLSDAELLKIYQMTYSIRYPWPLPNSKCVAWGSPSYHLQKSDDKTCRINLWPQLSVPVFWRLTKVSWRGLQGHWISAESPASMRSLISGSIDSFKYLNYIINFLFIPLPKTKELFFDHYIPLWGQGLNFPKIPWQPHLGGSSLSFLYEPPIKAEFWISWDQKP